MNAGATLSAGAPLSGLEALLRQRGLLVERIAGVGVADDPLITGVTHDSRRAGPGDLFVALRGARQDGRRFAPAAVMAGAVALISETPVDGVAVPQLVVGHGRRALALAAAWRFGFPSHELGVVGITGTDGKTTTAYLVRAVLEAAGRSSGLVGTVEVICAGHSLGNDARATTPEAPELQACLARMRDGGDRWAVIEATSHGLAQERVGEVAWDVAVLTNIGHEHLEFHGTHEAYRAAKRLLFERLARGPWVMGKSDRGSAVLNADDPHVGEFAAAARDAGARLIAYGTDASIGAVLPDATHLLARDVRHEGAGMAFRLDRPGGPLDVRLRLTGRFNVHNALAALGVAEALGLDPVGSARALGSVSGVPGRMQPVDLGQPFTVMVDYAHTAEALAKVLDELATVARAAGGGLIAVFGSAGERDTQKRPAMGRVAGERCRLVVLADEDPRGEDRMTILEAIAEGAQAVGRRLGHDLLLVPDRARAIRRALSEAKPGDVVLLAGKGHERSIEMAGSAMAWDEAAEARLALREAGYGSEAVDTSGEVEGGTGADGEGRGFG